MNRRLMLIIFLLVIFAIGLYFYPVFFSPQIEVEPRAPVDRDNQSNPFGTVKNGREEEASRDEVMSAEVEKAVPEESYLDSFRNPFADYRLNEQSKTVTAAAVIEEKAAREPVQTVQRPVEPARETDVKKTALSEDKKEELTPGKARAETGFELIGIMGNDLARRAIIREKDGQVLIIKKGDIIDDYHVLEITDGEVVFKYQGISFDLGMGGSHE